MANTCVENYIHIVFAVEGRQGLFRATHNDERQKTSCIISGRSQMLIAINNTPDHLHLPRWSATGYCIHLQGTRYQGWLFKIR